MCGRNNDVNGIMQGIIGASVLWMLIAVIAWCSSYNDAYRMGSAQGKAGMPSMYDIQQTSQK